MNIIENNIEQLSQLESYQRKQRLLGQEKFKFTKYDNRGTLEIGISANGEFDWSNETEILVPPFITIVDKSAFKSLDKIQRITFANPEIIKVIGIHAFHSCCSLIDIDLPPNIKQIGSKLFFNCCSLKSISIPNNCEKISDLAFCKCKSLKNIIINRYESKLINIDDNAFWECDSLAELNLPHSIQSIGTLHQYLDIFKMKISVPSRFIANDTRDIEKLIFYSSSDEKDKN